MGSLAFGIPKEKPGQRQQEEGGTPEKQAFTADPQELQQLGEAAFGLKEISKWREKGKMDRFSTSSQEHKMLIWKKNPHEKQLGQPTEERGSGNKQEQTGLLGQAGTEATLKSQVGRERVHTSCQ